MFDVLELIAPLIAVTAIGWLFARQGWISPAGVDGLTSFLVNLAVPALLFSAVSTAVRGGGYDLALVAGYFLAATASMLLGALVAWRFFRTAPDMAVIAGFTSTFSNAALLGIPVMDRAYGDIGLTTISLILAFHAPLLFGGSTVVIEGIRARQGGGGGVLGVLKTMALRLGKNPIVFGAAAGGLWGATGYDLPVMMNDTLDLMREGAAPAALFAVGAQLVGFSIAGDLKHTLVLVAAKMLVFPLLVAGAVLLIADPHPIAFAAAVTTAALPAGVNPVLLAQMYGMFTRRASGTMFLSTLISAVSVTALIAYFKGQGVIGTIG